MAVHIPNEILPATKAKVLGSCLECTNHKIIPDPDPNDWFCDDDVAVVCLSASNDKQNTESKWISDRHPNKVIEPSIRPFKVEKEATVPSWCPLKNTQRVTDAIA